MTTVEEDTRADELGGDASVATDLAPVRETTTAPPAPQKRVRGRRRFLVPALIAGLVVALSAAAVFGTLYLTAETTPADVGAFLAADVPQVRERSATVAELLLNYDSTNLEEVSRRMLEISTGNFREQYEQVLSSGPGLGAALEEASASSRGQILEGPEVYFRTPSEAIAILRVTQTAQSSSNPGGQTVDYVLKITLVETSDEGWKADRVEVLSTQQV